MDTQTPISFPGLHLSLNIPRVAFTIFGHPIYWYGIIIVVGLALAFLYAAKRSKAFHITIDDLTDVVLFAMIFGIIGARLYYVIFFSDPTSYVNPYFANPVTILQVWNGGLAIYGGIIGAFVTALIVCKVKKQNPLPYFDLAGLGFLIGQGIGRWGNFINREAYGQITSLPWRMVVDYTGQAHHPCFLYESLWCLLGFALLHFYSKRRKFNGEIFLMYAGWYSFGRFFIEGLRTDSLMLPHTPVRVSQLLAALVFITAVTLLVLGYVRLARRKNDTTDYTPLYASVGDDSDKVKDSADEKTEAESSSEPTYSIEDADSDRPQEASANNTDTAEEPRSDDTPDEQKNEPADK